MSNNNNNNVYKLKYVARVEFDDKTIGIKKEVSKNLQIKVTAAIVVV